LRVCYKNAVKVLKGCGETLSRVSPQKPPHAPTKIPHATTKKQGNEVFFGLVLTKAVDSNII
jgi:hypothetical protein